MGTEKIVVIIVPKGQKILEILDDTGHESFVDEEPDGVIEVEVKYE